MKENFIFHLKRINLCFLYFSFETTLGHLCLKESNIKAMYRKVQEIRFLKRIVKFE